VADVEGLIEHEGAETAIGLGHDWGGQLAWSFAQLKPERTAGVISLNTPLLPRGKVSPTEAMRARFGDDYYSLAFQAPGKAEAAFMADLDAFFSVIFSPPDPTGKAEPATLANLLGRIERHDRSRDVAVVPAADRTVFVEAFARTGFTGGFNWYRNLDANWARMEGVDPIVRAPSLMICAERDSILPPEMTRWMDQLTPDLEKHVVPGVGHWTQWEAPEAVSALVGAWLDRRFGAA
jgi:pimeloyl-ACP methyl ester carboxylesterase